MQNIITANELKTRGVQALNQATADGSEAIITIRGKDKYIVLPIESYNHLKEIQLEAALLETKKDLETDKYILESVEDHINRITSV